MVWGVLIVMVVLLAVVVAALVIRYNQLSLNRSLCGEARRQFDAARATRRGVMPVFLAEAGRALGDRDPHLWALQDAVEEAGQALARRDAGPAEHAVTETARTLAARLQDAAEGAGSAGTAVRGTAGARAGQSTHSRAVDLHTQLEEHETHIGAAVRHHNASIRWYMRRRAQALSLPLRGVFGPLPEIDYTPSEAVDSGARDLPSPGAEGYRPGPVVEGA